MTSIPRWSRRARELARRAGEPVTELARTHTTVSVERAVLRLAGLDGADSDGMPWVNRLADAVREAAGLEHGIALPVWDAMLAGGYPDLRTLAADAAAGQVKFRLPGGTRGTRPGKPRFVRSKMAWPGSMPSGPSGTGCWPSPPTRRCRGST